MEIFKIFDDNAYKYECKHWKIVARSGEVKKKMEATCR